MKKKMRRPLFTDGFNSVGHVLIGVISKWWLWFVPIFIIYEILDHDDVNLSVDIAEYLIGLMAAMAITSSSWMTAGLIIMAAAAFAYHFHASSVSGEKTIVQQILNK
jgi:hypothetical protein